MEEGDRQFILEYNGRLILITSRLSKSVEDTLQIAWTPLLWKIFDIKYKFVC